MEKQEVLEKIIYYLTKQKPEIFYEVKKGKCFINISEIENVINRQARVSFSNEDENYEQIIETTVNNYKTKHITRQELKNEIGRIMYNEANNRDKKLADILSIPNKRKLIEENIKNTLVVLEGELKKVDINLCDINLDLYFTNYVLFVHRFHQGCSRLFETCTRISTAESYTDFMCRESVLENIVKDHYKYTKERIKKEQEKNKSRKEYYTELKNNFLSITTEELYLPIEKLWNIKLDLDVLYYVPAKEPKLTSFYFITDAHRVNKHVKIDPCLYFTLTSIQQLYIEEGINEFRSFYYDVFGTNFYKKDFLAVLKNKGGWVTVRNLFINLCIVSNTYIFGELLRNLTKEKKFYDDAIYDKSYPSYINNDIISQKIKSGIETQKQIDDFIIQCNVFDRRDDLDSDFSEKITELRSLIFDDYNAEEEEVKTEE